MRCSINWFHRDLYLQFTPKIYHFGLIHKMSNRNLSGHVNHITPAAETHTQPAGQAHQYCGVGSYTVVSSCQSKSAG